MAAGVDCGPCSLLNKSFLAEETPGQRVVYSHLGGSKEPPAAALQNIFCSFTEIKLAYNIV